MSWDGDQMVLTGFTISGTQGPPGPAGTGVPGNYIGDEDGNTRVTINTIDHILLRTDGQDHIILDDNGQLLFGDDDPTTTQGKFNLVHTGNDSLLLDNHGTVIVPAGIWFRKSSFFTLVVELIKYYKEKGSLPVVDKAREMLSQFEERVYASKNKDVKKDRFAEYYFYTFQGTNGITGRNARGKLLKEYLNKI